MKPDSEKSTLELAQDKVKGAADSAASVVQPGEHQHAIFCSEKLLTPLTESEKGIGQKVSITTD